MNATNEIAKNFHSPVRGIDIPMMRHELESAAALTMPDLTHELCCQREELPALHFWIGSELPSDWQVARLMATCFEAGRRYGLLSAIELLHPDTQIDDDDPFSRQRIKYGGVQTVEQAQAINEFEAVFNQTMADIEREFPAAFEDETRTAKRLLRLKREQPQLYELLRDVVRAERNATPSQEVPQRRTRCRNNHQAKKPEQPLAPPPPELHVVTKEHEG